jgi:NADH:ubiquinone oxidoreductase subunit 6 (subunit J)
MNESLPVETIFSLVYMATWLLSLVTSLANVGLEAILMIGVVVILGSILVSPVSKRMGKEIRAEGKDIICGGISGYVFGVIANAFSTSISFPFNLMISLVFLILSWISIGSLLKRF